MDLELGKELFIKEVQRLRALGMNDEFVARQIVDDCFRNGLDLRFKQHLVFQLIQIHCRRD